MIICKNCGVELETDMEFCPLCEEPVNPVNNKLTAKMAKPEYKGAGWDRPSHPSIRNMSQPQRKATWELISIILNLIVIATSLLNYILNKEISWSVYPVAICLITFSYISFFAFLRKRRGIQVICAFLTASVLVFILDKLTGGLNWSLRLGIPLLLSINITFVGLLLILRGSKQKGINLIAYFFLLAALLSISVETIIDLYVSNCIHLVWSLIVSACVFPIATVLLFMHFRLKKGNELNKTFHI